MSAQNTVKKEHGPELSLAELSVSTSSRRPTEKNSAFKPAPVSNSWEEEVDSSSSSAASPPQTPTTALPSAPPPTPIAPTCSPSHMADWSSTQFSYTKHVPMKTTRPEKQTTVAGRMIAGALGVRTPPKSEEGKAYEKALKEKEKKRREREKEERRREEEATEKARRDVWEA